MPLVAIPETLLREVEGYTILVDWWRSTPRSGVTGRFDWWIPPCQLIVSMFASNFFGVAVGGAVYQVFVSWLRMPRKPCELQLLVDSVVFPTEPPPQVQGGGAISVNGCCSMQNRYLQALRVPPCAGRAACERDVRRSWSCTHLLDGNSNKMGGCQRSAALVCL